MTATTDAAATPRAIVRRTAPVPYAPLLLALCTLVLLVAAYTQRPAATIDLGDYADYPFISGFHAREVSPSQEPIATPWTADAPALTLPGARSGLWMIIVEAAPGIAAADLRLTTLAVNGVRMDIARRTGSSFTAVLPPAVVAAPQLELTLAPALTGGNQPVQGTALRVLVAPAVTYRWTTERGTVSFPAIGGGDTIVAIELVTRRPAGAAAGAQLLAGDTALATLPDNAERVVSLLVPARALSDGTLDLTITAAPFRDPRPLGVLLRSVRVVPAGGTATPLPPPFGLSLAALATTLGGYLVLARTTRRPLVAALTLVALAAIGAWALTEWRGPVAVLLPRLAALALWSVALLLLLERLLPRIFAAAGFPLDSWTLRALLLVFFVGYWLKAGGMLWPYFVAIDVSWHMERARWILEGRFWELYGTRSPLNESTMPVAEWGNNPPVIPYSPWFHILAATFAWLPLPMEATGNQISALLDASRVFLLVLLARAFGLSERQSVAGAALLALTPATFLLHSWGNLPTGYGLWLNLATTTLIAVKLRELDRPRFFWLLVALLVATLLIYTVMATFILVFGALLVPLLFFTTPRGERRPIIALGLAGLTALGLTILIYYGQYIGPILERTIPYFVGADRGEGVNSVQREGFGAYLAGYWPRMGYLRITGHYGMQIPLLLAIAGIALVRGRAARAILLCWALTAGVFLLAGSRISMVDKHLFYLLPALALLAGAALGWLWEHGRLARIAVLGIYAFSAISAVSMWLYRVASVQQ